jgi:hypothetical protein
MNVRLCFTYKLLGTTSEAIREVLVMQRFVRYFQSLYPLQVKLRQGLA